MCFGLADITGAAQTKGPHALRNRCFNAFSQRILSGKSGRFLPTTSGLKRFMLALRSDGESAPLVLLFRTDTVALTRTAPAIGAGELDLDHLIFPIVDGRSPIDTVLPCGANGLLMFPIDVELAGIDTSLSIGGCRK